MQSPVLPSAMPSIDVLNYFREIATLNSILGHLGWDTEVCLPENSTYTLGNLIAAQYYSDFKVEHPDWENRIENGEFLFIKEFLSRFHKFGATEDFKGTYQRVFPKTPLSEVPLIQYLDERYSLS